MCAAALSERRLLAINAGSSSLKFAVYSADEPPAERLRGSVAGIGKRGASLTLRSGGETEPRRDLDAGDHRAALAAIWEQLAERGELDGLIGAGHRVVHGGPMFREPRVLTAAVLDELRRLVPFAPDHLPAEIALIEAVQAQRGELPQIACFDTAFHAGLPRVARVLPLPRRLERRGVRRYGFHGLSYQFLMDELRRVDPRAAAGRVILAHLGNGASLAAVLAGRGVDTSMAFTPAAGVPMATRSGDLDPGLVSYLAQAEHMTPARFHRLVNFEAGLLGLAETSGDLRELLPRSESDPRAAEAIAVFCYQVKKWIGGFAAALGGLDALVFSGGIGENLAAVRARVCAGLAFLGIELDPAANEANAAVVSRPGAAVGVRVIATDEEQVIARATARVLEFAPLAR